MPITRHGLSIGLERINNEFFLSLKPTGKLTHKDYEVITPFIDSALEGVKDPRINALIDARELDGWELHAAWDDFKLGLKYNNAFAKVAVVGDKKWQENVALLGGWFIGGEAEYFEKPDAALKWLDA